jgi:nucleoid-associated protein YgaU
MAIAMIALATLIYGCPPEADHKRAGAAIDEAKKAGATQYAPEDLAAAEQAMAEGDALMKKFAYKQAQAKYEEAYRLALAAREKAIAAQREEQPKPEVAGGQKQPDNKPADNKPAPSDGKKTYTVVEGDCLWWIAEDESVYGDPFQWPLIYWENQEEIDKAANEHGKYNHEEDWIYPGQEFTVPPNDDVEQVKKARKQAGAPAPYTPPEK